MSDTPKTLDDLVGCQPYEKTAIYRTSESILTLVSSLHSKYDRKDRYTFGSRIYEQAITLVETIAWAYMETVKLSVKIALIRNIIRKAVGLLIQVRVGNRRNIIKGDDQVELVNNVVSIIKQAQGWLNSLENNTANFTARAQSS